MRLVSRTASNGSMRRSSESMRARSRAAISSVCVLTRVMSSYLFGVGPMDPLTYVAVSALLAGISVLAIYLPARRAARVDPNVALRADT